MSEPAALLLSVILEAPVAAFLVWWTGWGCPARTALVALPATVATHPLAWEAMVAFIPVHGYAPAVGAVECGVVLVETVFYALLVPLGRGRALAVSAAANAASVAGGLGLAMVWR